MWGAQLNENFLKQLMSIIISSNRLEYEFVCKGSIFRKGRIKVTVSKVYKIIGADNLEGVTGSHLVELSVLAPSGQDAVGEDMKNFADQLKPLVMLDKFDIRRAM